MEHLSHPNFSLPLDVHSDCLSSFTSSLSSAFNCLIFLHSTSHCQSCKNLNEVVFFPLTFYYTQNKHSSSVAWNHVYICTFLKLWNRKCHLPPLVPPLLLIVCSPSVSSSVAFTRTPKNRAVTHWQDGLWLSLTMGRSGSWSWVMPQSCRALLCSCLTSIKQHGFSDPHFGSRSLFLQNTHTHTQRHTHTHTHTKTTCLYICAWVCLLF